MLLLQRRCSLSGPKVVKVVTREEQIATCSALLAQLNRGVTQWINECNRLGGIDNVDIGKVLKTKEKIEAYLKNENFQQIQIQVPRELSYLVRDLEQRRDRAAEVSANTMQIIRQQRKNAEILLRELEKKSFTLDSEILRALTEICKSYEKIPYAEKILSEAFSIVTNRGLPPTITNEQRELAARLSSGENKQSFTDWVNERSHRQDDRVKKVDKKIAELQNYLDEKISSTFLSRLRSIELESDESLLNARLDSLVIELSIAVEKAKQDESILNKAYDLLASIEAAQNLYKDGSLFLVHRDLADALSKKDLVAVSSAMEICTGILKAINEKSAADNRRNAILSGLASLGYEVNESMSTAFTNKGRVVVQKPNLPGYGVELAGAPDAARLQVRAVTFTHNRDHNRERDVETIWCNDFHKLQELISSNGGSISIEKSFEIGAVPLHVVPVPDQIVGEIQGHASVFRK